MESEWEDKIKKVLGLILEYDPSQNIDSLLEEKSEFFVDPVEKAFFFLRVLVNIQVSVMRYGIHLCNGKLKKEKTESLCKRKRTFSLRLKNLNIIEMEIVKVLKNLDNMSQDQKLIYKKEHGKDLLYIYDYYFSFAMQSEVRFCKKLRTDTRRIFKKDRWWSWFKYTGLGREMLF